MGRRRCLQTCQGVGECRITIFLCVSSLALIHWFRARNLVGKAGTTPCRSWSRNPQTYPWVVNFNGCNICCCNVNVALAVVRDNRQQRGLPIHTWNTRGRDFGQGAAVLRQVKLLVGTDPAVGCTTGKKKSVGVPHGSLLEPVLFICLSKLDGKVSWWIQLPQI